MSGPYYVFDLDETLAEVFPLFSWLDTFLPQPQPRASPQSSSNVLWDAFVDELLLREQQRPQILRPGILQVMEILAAKQRAGEIRGVVVYSNSTYLESLHLVCDLLHRHLASVEPVEPITLPNLFSKQQQPPPLRLVLDCVHWDHPHRRETKKNHTATSQKSWEELRNVMIHGRTGAPDTLQPSDVYFFDDRVHEALYAALPAGHYVQVPAYQECMPQEELAEVMRAALERVPRHVAADWRHRVQAMYHPPAVDPVTWIATQGRSNPSSPLYQEVTNRLDVGQTRETGQEGIQRMLAVIRPAQENLKNLKVRGGRGGRRRKAHAIRRTGTIRRTPRRRQKTRRTIRRQ